jgi:Rrf2 family nitric oxide-sensitive transcriptional repressor
MQLTRYSDYSLRVLMHLAVTPSPLSRIEEIADAYGISRGHVMKVVRHLAALGLVETVRGRGGGLRLARPPEAVNVGRVIRQTEENLALVECFRPDGRCPIAPACVLRTALGEALDAFLAVLDGYTLADLVARRRAPLARLLGIGPPSRAATRRRPRR